MESAATDAALRREVERLRSASAGTKELYQAVAAVMFFRYQLVPTANRMHVLVGKGSMTTASNALARFWHEVRQAARPAVEHPDLPPDLARRAGDLVVQLWAMARQEAGHGGVVAGQARGGAVAAGEGHFAADLARELAEIRAALLADAGSDAATTAGNRKGRGAG